MKINKSWIQSLRIPAHKGKAMETAQRKKKKQSKSEECFKKEREVIGVNHKQDEN